MSKPMSSAQIAGLLGLQARSARLTGQPVNIAAELMAIPQPKQSLVVLFSLVRDTAAQYMMYDGTRSHAKKTLDEKTFQASIGLFADDFLGFKNTLNMAIRSYTLFHANKKKNKWILTESDKKDLQDITRNLDNYKKLFNADKALYPVSIPTSAHGGMHSAPATTAAAVESKPTSARSVAP